MTNRGGGSSQEGGAWHVGWPLQKFMKKLASSACKSQKTKRNVGKNATSTANKRANGRGRGGDGGGARLAWRPRVQRGVGQVQRRLKSLIIASNALAQRAPRRATKKEREENPKTKMLREKMQKCATKRSAKRGREGGKVVGGAIKKRVSSSPKLAQRNAAAATAAATPPRVAMNDLQ